MLQILLFLGCALILSSCAFKSQAVNYTSPYFPRYKATNKDHLAKSKKETVKVATYNIKFSKKIPEALRLIKEHQQLKDIDVLCLQEMDPHGVKQIAAELGLNYVYYPAAYHKWINKDFGNAILSKWPILSDEKFILPFPESKKMQRIAVGAKILIQGREVNVYNVHKEVHMDPNIRTLQTRALKDIIPSDSDYVIIAGDFNTFTKQSIQITENILSEADIELVSKDAGWTYRHWYLLNRKSQLDHIFTKNMKQVQAGKVSDWTPSDHFPVWVELEFKDERTSRLAQTDMDNKESL